MNTSSRNLGTIELNPISQQHQNNQASQSPPSLNLPSQDLLNGSREEYNTICVPLYNAIATGELEDAKVILDNRSHLVRFSITESYNTALHIAVLGRSYQLSKYLICLMTKEDLELQNGNGETALFLAARVGDVETAKSLMQINKSLIDISDSQGRMPLHVATLFERHHMVRYLYSFAKEMGGGSWTHQDRSLAFERCVAANQFDVALQMVKDSPEVAVNGLVLRLLAEKPEALRANIRGTVRIWVDDDCYFMQEYRHMETEAIQLLRIVLEGIMKLPKAQIDDIMRGPPDHPKDDEKQPQPETTREALQVLRTVSENIEKKSIGNLSEIDEEAMTMKEAKKTYSSQALFIAAETGNTAFINEVIRRYPNLAMEVNDNNHSIFHVGISHRHWGIYELLIENDHIMNSIIYLEDQNGNNMLHLVGETPTGKTREDVILYQELSWFKLVRKILPSHLQRKKNTAGLTPIELFVKNNKDLYSNDEKLKREMSTQLMVVAALIATISFAAVFTSPGGYNQDTGTPLLLQKTLFKIFIVFDSLSFISSTTSILVVLSIILSRHNTPDANRIRTFSSPRYEGLIKLCHALVIISIATIVITFLITLFLLYQSSSRWLPILISTSAIIPYSTLGIMDGFLQDYFLNF